MSDDVKDILEKVSDDGDDIFEKVSDDVKDILENFVKYSKMQQPGTLCCSNVVHKATATLYSKLLQAGTQSYSNIVHYSKLQQPF